MHSIAIRGIVLALTIIFAAVSAAINLPAPETPASARYGAEPEPRDAERVSVTILQRFEDTSFSLQQVCGLYSEESDNNARFLIKTVPVADYEAALRAALLSGENADLFQIEGTRELLAYKESISPLNIAWAGSAAASLADAATLNGIIYALPYSMEGFGFVLNRDIFEAAGVSLPPPGMPALLPELRTAELLGERFRQLRDVILSGGLAEEFPELEAVAEFPAHDDAILSGGFLDILMSGAYESPAEAAASPANLVFPAAQDTEELVKLMALSPEQEQTERLAKGQVAVILGDTDVYKHVNAINPEMQGRLRLLPVPLGLYEQPSAYVSAKCYWAINASCAPKTAAAARGFLTWLYRSPQGTKALAETLEALSPYRDTAQTTGAALHAHLLSCIDAGLYLPRYARELDPAWRKDVFSPAVRGYFTQLDKTWPQAMEDAGITAQIID